MQTATDAVIELGAVEIDDAIFAVDARADAPTQYDRMGALYDGVCGTTAYNLAVWGTTPDRSRLRRCVRRL